ncbi:MAG: hypothetical protein PVG20_02600 [Thioalkalispiraceae bacterium]|jgi:hypothetical protein
MLSQWLDSHPRLFAGCWFALTALIPVGLFYLLAQALVFIAVSSAFVFGSLYGKRLRFHVITGNFRRIVSTAIVIGLCSYFTTATFFSASEGLHKGGASTYCVSEKNILLTAPLLITLAVSLYIYFYMWHTSRP